MDEILIKKEVGDISGLHCYACLSIGRKLQPIGNYLETYQMLLQTCQYSEGMENFQFCWECHTKLRKVYLFQKQVIMASEMIKTNQSYIYGTLSCLTTVIMNDLNMHTIYVNEETSPTKIKCENIITNEVFPTEIKYTNEPTCGNSEFSDNEISNFVDDIDVKIESNNTEVLKEENMENNTKVLRKSKWAKKKALQNKKPKFKVVTNDLTAKDVFKRVQIDIDQLKERIAKERDSDVYRSSKYKCRSCVEVFKSDKMLTRHNSLRHSKDSGSYICDICKCRLSKQKLSDHMRDHYTLYECSLCKMLCKKNATKRHLKKQHGKEYQCLKCDFKASCRQDVLSHCKEKHEKFICDICGVTFRMKYCIRRHLRKQHSPLECSSCGKRFSRYSSLWVHRKLHHSPPAQPAYCVECDRQFADVFRYRWHLAHSARHKPRRKVRIPCPDCDKVFTKKIYMTNHYDLVHLKKFRYRCESCDKNFLRNSDLVLHNRRVHEGILPPKNKICNVCGKGFTTNKILSNHVRTHTGERPFACAACPARFTQLSTLRSHCKMHSHEPQPIPTNK